MSLITLFSAPKPFSDPHIAIIQRNAIKSWTLLPDVDVTLFGDEDGLGEAARDLGVQHIPDIPRSPSGAPIMDAMFRLVRESGQGELFCIVNADIILFPDFVEAARLVATQREKFVMLGQRWDMDITKPLDFSDSWQEMLKLQVRNQGELHRPAGSDYFLFPRDCYTDIPAFAIGRAGWDNWMIYHARKSGFPAIDATHDVMIIHQNHDYRHLPDGQPHYQHPETDENIRLAGGRAVTRFTLLDIDHRLVGGQIRLHKIDGERLARRMAHFPLLAFGSTRLSNLLWRWRKSIRRKKS